MRRDADLEEPELQKVELHVPSILKSDGSATESTPNMRMTTGYHFRAGDTRHPVSTASCQLAGNASRSGSLLEDGGERR